MLRNVPYAQRKSQLGQYFTPDEIAVFMAGLFTQDEISNCRLLDAGAGTGSLTAAFLDRCISGSLSFESVEIDAFEIDGQLHPALSNTLEQYIRDSSVSLEIRSTDFIHTAADWVAGNYFAEELPKYSHAILNPPYKKLRSNSSHRAALRRAGIEAVNLYAAFLALALALLDDNGQLVAIVPRSFCNGAYYRSFRGYLLRRAALHQIHLFESRNRAFAKDDVLQENIIVLLERNGKQGGVKVSTSTDATYSDLSVHEHPFDQIVFPDDSDKFIHVPTSKKKTLVELNPNIKYSLSDLSVSVSTGPVVDFRAKEHLCHMPSKGTVPLLYPGHCKGGAIVWPVTGLRKPNAIRHNAKTKKWLYPNGHYCLVRRFSSKEERRRIVASVVDPAALPNFALLGFENHLNVFHENKRGLPEALAHGLATYLNSTAVDEYFRRFNGHTQVNAADLRLLKYPPRTTLIRLGRWVMQERQLDQSKIDERVRVFTHDQ